MPQRRRSGLGSALALVGLLAGISLFSQEAAAGNPEPAEASSSVLSHYLAQDIELSSASELAARLRALGLSDQGTLTELKQRLRQYYKLDQMPAAPSATPSDATNPDSALAEPGNAATPAPAAKQALDIRIETAGSAQYFTVEEVDEDYLRLGGGVLLIVNDTAKNANHRIRADQVVYNRKADVMVARGRVDYTLNDKGKIQVFQGSELRFSLTSMEVFILDGVLHNKQAVGGLTLDFRIEGEEVSRNDRNLVVLDQATVSSSTAKPPAYRVTAGHIWLLSAGEWAIRDGVLHLGRVPLMYIPFFYYPNDDLVFHPVAGVQEPEGAYLQTTTYLVGQKSKSQAPFSFMQFGDSSGENEYRLRGLFLENAGSSGSTSTSSSDAPKSAATSSSNMLKLMLDAYSRYGFLAGLQGRFAAGTVATFDFAAAAGFSRALYRGMGGVGWSSYYTAAGAGTQEYWESGYLFGVTVPFRFLAELQSSVKLEGFQLGLNFPLSGDPGFRSSFLNNRKEEINWGKLIGLNKTTGSSGTAISAGSDTMNMALNMSWNPGISALRPFVDSLALSNLDASLNWNARSWVDAPAWVNAAALSADKRFWTPELLALPKLALNMSGTLFQFPWPNSLVSPTKDKTNGEATATSLPPAPEFLLPGSEYVVKETEETSEKDNKSAKPDAETAENPDMAVEVTDTAKGNWEAPTLPGASVSGLRTSDWQVRLGYSLVPGLVINSRFAAADSTSPLNMPSTLSYWSLQDRISGSLKFNASTPLSILALDSSVNLSGQDQSLLSLDPSAPANIAANVNAETARAKYLTIDNANTLRLSPFQGTGWFDASSVEYGISMIWYRNKWESGLSADGAVYKTETLDWTKDLITRHFGGLNLSFVAAPLSAHLTGQFVFPPLQQSINTHADVNYEKLSLSADENFNLSSDLSTLTPSPLRLSLGLPIFDWLSTAHSLEINMEKNLVSAYSGSLNLAGFNLGLQAKPAADQSFNRVSRSWITSGSEYFRVSSASLDYSFGYEPDPFWYNRMKTKLSINGRWSQNFIVITDSVFNWNLGWDFKVADFLDFSFTVGGQNNRMFRYVPEFNKLMGIDDTRDFLQDLINSFGLGWNEDTQSLVASDNYRQGSYFKMNSISIKAVHYLGDWQLSLAYTGQPAVQTNVTTKLQEIKWSYQFSASVAWYPITEVQNTVKAYYDTNTQKDRLSIE